MFIQSSTRILCALVLTTCTLGGSAQIEQFYNPSFGGGVQYADELRETCTMAGLFLRSDGQRLVVGECDGTGGAFTALMDADGMIVRDYGWLGRACLGTYGYDNTTMAAMQSDGRTIISNLQQSLHRVELNGSIDPSFTPIDQLGGQVFFPTHLSIQADDRILLSGSSGLGDGRLGRYMPDGLPDMDFGADGCVIVSPTLDVIKAVALSDGRIAVAVGSSPSIYEVHMLLSTGEYDAGFGVAGIMTDFLAFGFNEALDLAFRPDGEFYLIGNQGFERYEPDGLSLEASWLDQAEGGDRLWLQPDGKILTRSSSHFLSRALPNGTFDLSFNGNGHVDVLHDYEHVCILPDRILVGGNVAYEPVSPPMYVVEVSNGGLLLPGPCGDTYFKFGGCGTYDVLVAIGTDALDRPILVDDMNEGVVLRYTGTGERDETFHCDGASAGGDENYGAFASHPDGALKIVGHHIFIPQPGGYAVHALTPDGEVDPAWNDEELPLESGLEYRIFEDIECLPDGRVLALGYTHSLISTTPTGHAVLARYTATGTLDDGFATNGLFYLILDQENEGHRLIPRNDGGYLLICVYENQPVNNDYHDGLLFVAIDSTGQLDESFGTDGMLWHDTGFEGTVAISEPVVLSNGGFYLSVNRWVSGGQVDLARFHADGTLDAAFGGDGVVTCSSQESSLFGGTWRYNLSMLSSGIIVHSRPVIDAPAFVIEEFHPTGEPVITFGDNGVLVISGNASTVTIMAQHMNLADDRIIISGHVWYLTDSVTERQDIFLFELDPLANGTTDALTGTHGIEVSPNPVIGTTLNVRHAITDPCTYFLYNAEGRLVHAWFAPRGGEPGGNVQLELPKDLATGEHLLVVLSSNTRSTGRVILAR